MSIRADKIRGFLYGVQLEQMYNYYNAGFA